MPIRSGVGAQLGLSTETTFGTYVAPTTFVEFDSESLELTKDYTKTAGLRAGQLAQSENLHVATTRSVAGSVNFDAQNKGLGRWLNLLHGNTVTPALTGGGIYLQTHNIGTSNPFGKSATVQVVRPGTGGTDHVFSYLGCKATEVVFTLERGGVVTAAWSIDGADETTAQTIATATYATDSTPFNFVNGSIEFDDAVLTDVVRSVTITCTNPQATDRFGIGAGAVKKEPIQNAHTVVTAALDMEFTSLTQHAAFTAATRRKFELNCTGTAIGSGTGTPFLNFTLASTVAVSSGPVVSGPDIITQSVSLEGLSNGTDPVLVVGYASGDSAI